MKTKFYLFSAMLASASMMAMAQQTPSYTRMTLPDDVSNGYFRGSVIFADVNSDNVMDFMMKGRDLNNGWTPEVVAVACDATHNFSSKIALPSETPYEATLTALDFNNDGHIDYMLSAYGQQLYQNNGDGSFTKVEGFSLESNINIGDDSGTSEMWYMGVTVAADFDLDGYTDIITKDADGNPALYKNNGGNGTFSLVTGSGLFAQRGGTMCVGDFNKDGYPDLLVSGWSDEVGNDCLSINKNNGDGTFTRVASDAFVGAEKGQVMFVDIDGDGYLDVFATGESCPESWAKIAYVYRNNGDETFTRVQTSLPGACKSGCDWADLNGDGNIDFVYAGETDNNSQAVVVINGGNLSLTAHEGLLCRARGGAAVAAYDVNGNGFPEVAIMGYNDDGAPHVGVFNGLCSRNMNENPTAPTGLEMTAEGGKVTFSWEAATDNKTPAAALRYNVYVKKSDGSIFTIIPADPATGALRLGDVNAASTACSYTLNIDATAIAEWGVQAIDGGKYASAFTVGSSSSIQNIAKADNIVITGLNGMISVNADASVEVYDLQGHKLVDATVNAGTPLATRLAPGAYVVKAATANGNAVKKMVLR